MDNLAHSLLGLSLAKSGLERATPLATTALVISSNLPDIDVLVRINGDTLTYLKYHRGITHSLVGLAVLAVALTLILWSIQKLPWYPAARRGPVKPLRLFLICYLGGLGHTFFDYTNSYGVRPFLPFSERWFYGDLIFVVDPWIWLILGASAVWLTATKAWRSALWGLLGVLTLLLIFSVRQNAAQPEITIPAAVRVIWSAGVAVIAAGALLKWRRAGEVLARGSLVLLVAYYAAMSFAHHSAVSAARSEPGGSAGNVAAWPAPANSFMWQVVKASDASLETGWTSLLRGDRPGWREVNGIEAGLRDALERDWRSREFLGFTRFTEASVELDNGLRVVRLRDLRFTLMMVARMGEDNVVQSVDVRWY